MNFAMSYSFGKDSAFALYKMTQAGHKCVCLITTIDESNDRTWIHGIPKDLAERAAGCMGLPMVGAPCKSADYQTAFETALCEARDKYGATACVFGDMDIPDHLVWNQARCAAVGIACETPLWGKGREEVVKDELAAGFTGLVKLVWTKYLGTEFLGKTLDTALVDKIRATGADVCGENGEYHTFVTNGPIFKKTVSVTFGEIVQLNPDYAAIDIR